MQANQTLGFHNRSSLFTA